METIESVGQGYCRCDRSYEVDDRRSKDEYDPVRFVVGSQAHHKETYHHPNQGKHKQMQFVFCFGNSVVLLRLADGVPIGETAAENGSARQVCFGACGW